MKKLLLTTCLICAASASAQASPVTFSGEFSAESDKVFFHGTTTELIPHSTSIYVTSTGAAGGGFATSISYWEPSGIAHGFVGTELGHPDAQASRDISGTDYFFALTMLGNTPIGDFGQAFAPGGAGVQTAFAFDGFTGSAYCSPGVGLFCLSGTRSIHAQAIGRSHSRASIPSSSCPSPRSPPHQRSHSFSPA